MKNQTEINKETDKNITSVKEKIKEKVVNTKPFELLESKHLTVLDIIPYTLKDSDTLKRIEIKTLEYGTIKFTPKKKIESAFSVKGRRFHMEDSENSTIEELPKKFFDMYDLFNSDGKIFLLSDITKWNRLNENTGDMDSGYFISEKQFEEIEIYNSKNEKQNF